MVHGEKFKKLKSAFTAPEAMRPLTTAANAHRDMFDK